MKNIVGKKVRAAVRRIATLSLCSVVGMAGAQTTSKLWGTHGELWKADSRVTDFSSAGYKSQKSAIPTRAVVKNVKDFGAVGDGVADDTKAFANAIAATENGALLIPAGRYQIQDVLKIAKSNITLMGEGQGKSVLYLPKSLSDILPQQKADWPYQGGFVWIEGEQKGGPLSLAIGEEKRGSLTLKLDDVRDIAVGQTLRLVEFDNAARGLVKHLQGNLPPQSDEIAYVAGELGSSTKLVDWVFKVAAVDGNTITLDRPLHVDVKKEWSAQIYRHDPTVHDVGVEGLTFEFAGVAKKAHNSEAGFNAVFLRQATDVWVRDVEIVDADYAVNARAFVYNGQFQDITVRAGKRVGETCHHGFNASILSQDNLFNRLRFTNTYCTHDLTVEAFANGNVFENSTFQKARFDHHRAAPYDNLFTNLHTADGTEVYKWGGAANRGPQSGRHETFWNITANGKLQALPVATEFPLMTVVGLNGYTPDTTSADRWIESGASTVTPLNIHEAQLAKGRGVYEAETAVTTGAVAKTLRSTPKLVTGAFTGSGYVDFVNATGDSIEWTVVAPKAGTYQLNIRYALGSAMGRNLAVEVNGVNVAPQAWFAPSGSWTAWKNFSLTTPLPGNVPVKVRLSTTGANGPDVDSLTVLPN